MAAQRKIKASPSHLKIVKGGKNDPMNSVIDNTWMFIHAALWDHEEFSDKEIEQFKKLISEHYHVSKNSQNVFEELIERVCLAKRFVNRRHGRYVAKPIDWLNIHYYAGLAGTQGWYNEVCLQRITVPEYNKGLTILAKGILKYLQEPSAKTILSYRKKLIAEKQFDLLQIFNNTIVQHQINN